MTTPQDEARELVEKWMLEDDELTTANGAVLTSKKLCERITKALTPKYKRIEELEGSRAVLLNDYQAAINARDGVAKDRDYLIQCRIELEARVQACEKVIEERGYAFQEAQNKSLLKIAALEAEIETLKNTIKSQALPLANEAITQHLPKMALKIDALEQENTRYRNALLPFAADYFDNSEEVIKNGGYHLLSRNKDYYHASVYFEDVRRAKAALQAGPEFNNLVDDVMKKNHDILKSPKMDDAGPEKEGQ